MHHVYDHRVAHGVADVCQPAGYRLAAAGTRRPGHGYYSNHGPGGGRRT